MGVATLVLCPYANSWPHMLACVTDLQPFTLVSAHSRHARHWSHHGTLGVDCTVPCGPTNRQYGPVRPYPAVSVRFLCIPSTRPAPSCCLRGLVFRILRPDQSCHLSSGEPLATSWIFPVRHSYLALVSINPSVDLRVHCVVYLAQDRFPYGSLGQLRLGKAAKGVAPVPSSEPNVTPPPSGAALPSSLGRERREQTNSPKKRLHHQ